jgi:histidyl-tRNA synthetase
MKKIGKPRGTRDILPSEQKYWSFVYQTFERKVVQQGFEKIETPIFENAEVFRRPLGETSDIVEKQMFGVSRMADARNNPDAQRQLVLRPENTAPIIRSYLETNLGNLPQPLKLYYSGPMFRYDRPQKDRLRQFNQVGFEVIGDGSSATDALVIFLTYQILKSLKLAKDINIEVNSIGCKTCKPEISKELREYFQRYRSGLCQDCSRRIDINPLRVLDCRQKKCQEIVKASPEIVDLICETCKRHFRETLEYLDDLQISYDLNSNLVRGLDYYTRTTFEITIKGDERRQSSLGGGGRYDGLSEMLGGASTPGIGVALGVERIINQLKKGKIEVPNLPQPQIILIQLGTRARRKVMELLPKMTQKGFRIFSAPGKESLKAQLRLADRKNIRLAVIIGEREVFDNCAIVKDMENNSQESVTLGRLMTRLKTLLKKR